MAIILYFVIFAYFLRLVEANNIDSISTSKDRIVTVDNYEAVKFGVPLDFGFNETNNLASDGIPSSPGCPKSYEGYPWVYFGSPPFCFLVGTQGPCSSGQLIFGNGTSNYGICDCHCHPKNCTESRRELTYFDQIVQEYQHYRFCYSRELPEIGERAFDKENGTCFFLETKGICDDGEWAVREGENVTCVSQCSNVTGVLSDSTFDRHEKKCKLKISETILPISLSIPIGQQTCEDGMVFSKPLLKCIPKAKAYLMRF